jgi:hypothetical protein
MTNHRVGIKSQWTRKSYSINENSLTLCMQAYCNMKIRKLAQQIDRSIFEWIIDLEYFVKHFLFATPLTF